VFLSCGVDLQGGAVDTCTYEFATRDDRRCVGWDRRACEGTLLWLAQLRVDHDDQGCGRLGGDS